MPDVNWPLSAMMQSGAAIVAIAGGLIGARYVSLHGEVTAARHERKRAGQSFLLAKDQHKRDVEARLDILAREFLVTPQRLDQLIDLEQIEDVRREARATFSEETFCNRVLILIDEFGQEALHARAQISLDLEMSTRPQLWREFSNTREYRQGIRSVWHHVYVAIVREGVSRGEVNEVAPLEDELKSEDRRRSAWLRKDVRSKNARESESSTKVEDALAEYQIRASHETRLTSSEGFGLALQVLIVMSALMILLPLACMIPVHSRLSSWVLAGVGVSFVVGLATLGRYLAVYGQVLHGTRDGLPRSLVRLMSKRDRATPEAEARVPGEEEQS